MGEQVMSKMQEVEQKFPIKNAIKIIDKLDIIAKKIVTNQKQFDTYYMPAHKNYLEGDVVSEWLRLRETGMGQSDINYKCWLPYGAKIQNHCNEYQSAISDIEAVKKIFEALGIAPIVKVFKIRNSWEYKNVEISLDSVEGLGDFIELEFLEEVEEQKIDDILLLFKTILAELGAETGLQDRRGYPYLALEHKLGRSL